MPDFTGIGKMILLAGIILVAVGLLVTLIPRIPLLGKLPGDIHIQRGNLSFYFPITTWVLLSLILSLLFWFLRR